MSGIYGSEYGQDIIPGEIGSNAITQAADNSGNTVANVGGLTENVFDPTYGGTLPAVNQGTDWSKALGQAKTFINENKGLITAAGALAAANSSPTVDKKTGYQGGIPLLQASRSMYTRPPTKAQGYRPGAGGIDYGGDVTYTRMAPGSDPWAALSGTSGSTANANLTTLPENVANAVANAITGNATNTTVTGSGTNTSTTGLTQAQKDAIAVDNWRKSLTPQQYLASINQWIADHPNMSKADLDAAMAKFKVTQTDLQTALGQNEALSAADIYALSHGMGLKEANAQQTAGIKDWIAKNPYATADQIKDAIKSSGVSTSDIKEALTGSNLSKGYQEALTSGMGLNAYYNNINKFIEDQNRDTSTPNYLEEFSRAKAKQDFGVSDADIAAAQKYAATEAGKKELESMYVNNAAAEKAAADAQAKAAAEWERQNAAKWEAENAARWEAENAAKWEKQHALDVALANLGLNTEQTPAPVVKPSMDDYYQDYYAEGGMAKGRYLQGETDGMADELPAQIGQDQPAALSHGEFVVPADVVSHLGNGNSDAGAKKLYQMMDKIRMARTGNKKQGKRINPDKFMPGGLAYAKGGKVKKFAGETSSMVTANNQYGSGIQGIESNLSNWAGPYVTNMLGQGQALANMPYAAYMGPLTAGESPLQTGAFKTAAGLTTPTSIGTAASTAGDIATTAKGLTYTPTTTTFDKDQAAAYMNPYLESALKPQLEEARRQSRITQQQNAAKMTQAGAFGGGRQAILDAETQRNLGTNLANITGQGYSTAYDKAMAQFNADQARKAQEAQFGATYGLQGLQTGLQGAQAQGALGAQENQVGLANLNAQLTAGSAQRGIESEGIAADKAQFEEARANPYKMVQFQQSLLQGLPLAAQSYQGIEPNALLKASQGATTVNQLLKNLNLI